MWVLLGLLWTGLGLTAMVGTEREGLEGAAFTIVMLLISLVPVCLIIQSSHPLTNRTAMRKPETRSCRLRLPLHTRQVLAEEQPRGSAFYWARQPTRFRGVRVGFDVAIKTGAFDSEATAA